MNTLKDIQFKIEIKDTDNLKKRLPGYSYDSLLGLTQEQAVREEIGWRLGDSCWFDFFEDMIEKYGGSINWDTYKGGEE